MSKFAHSDQENMDVMDFHAGLDACEVGPCPKCGRETGPLKAGECDKPECPAISFRPTFPGP